MPSFSRVRKTTGIGAGLIAMAGSHLVVGSGFIVQEGHRAVITQFGKYNSIGGCRFQLALRLQSDPAP
jgi:regulator of protease activity HflC (stomatin/prohibitin superfamily)